MVICMERRFFFAPRLSAPSPDLLQILHTPQVQAHSCGNPKQLEYGDQKPALRRFNLHDFTQNRIYSSASPEEEVMGVEVAASSKRRYY